MTRSRIALVAVLLTVIGTFLLLVEVVPPEARTRASMTRLEVRIRSYAEQDGRLPLRLADLPPDDEKYADSLKDGWGRPILYSASPDNVVTLWTEGQEGGKGKDRRMTCVFDIKAEPFRHTVFTPRRSEDKIGKAIIVEKIGHRSRFYE